MELISGHFRRQNPSGLLSLSPIVRTGDTVREKPVLPACGGLAGGCTSASDTYRSECKSAQRVLIPKLPQKHAGELHVTVLTAACRETKETRREVNTCLGAHRTVCQRELRPTVQAHVPSSPDRANHSPFLWWGQTSNWMKKCLKSTVLPRQIMHFYILTFKCIIFLILSLNIIILPTLAFLYIFKKLILKAA